jgi:hypothetical protein
MSSSFFVHDPLTAAALEDFEQASARPKRKQPAPSPVLDPEPLLTELARNGWRFKVAMIRKDLRWLRKQAVKRGFDIDFGGGK